MLIKDVGRDIQSGLSLAYHLVHARHEASIPWTHSWRREAKDNTGKLSECWVTPILAWSVCWSNWRKGRRDRFLAWWFEKNNDRVLLIICWLMSCIGPPGVGKTYTVGMWITIPLLNLSSISLTSLECIANYTRQPVLSLSGSDIEGMPSTKTKLQHWFDLAKAWDALILIDEADIFLTWRQPDNLFRNILVESRCCGSSLSLWYPKCRP